MSRRRTMWAPAGTRAAVAASICAILLSACGAPEASSGESENAGGSPEQTIPEANYDESLVPAYSLPDPLIAASGEAVTNADAWWTVRRPELLQLFEDHVYGRVPDAAREFTATRFEVLSEDREALGGRAIRKEIRVHLTSLADGPTLTLLLFAPADADGSVPAFLGLNYYGNMSVHLDPAIAMSSAWMRQNDDFGIVDNRATEATRGVRVPRWPIERILERGYGVATVYYGDVDPDFDDGFQDGIHPHYYRPEQTAPAEEEWGSIGAWAWGLSRALDYLATDETVDAERVAVMGHSRLGKTALWAGAQDQRFALVISNDSGAGGAALSRRRFGETITAINVRFPHWFNDRFNEYNGREDALPVDQHMLMALIAPRPVYVASAAEDQWADPRGEYLSAYHAGPVYELLGGEALASDDPPGVDQPRATASIGYHVRTGVHDVTAYDWERFMDFADARLGTPR